MALTTNEAFRVGFLKRCCDEGLTSEEVAERINLALEKKAKFGLGGLLSTGLWGAALLPPAAGALVGTTTGLARGHAANALDSTDDDDELANKYHQERLRQLYLRAAKQAKMRRHLKELQSRKTLTPRFA